MINKVLRPSMLVLAVALLLAPVGRMYADDPCNIVTGCDPVPPPDAGTPSLITILLSVFGLS